MTLNDAITLNDENLTVIPVVYFGKGLIFVLVRHDKTRIEWPNDCFTKLFRKLPKAILP